MTAEFRSNHVSLWIGAAYGIPLYSGDSAADDLAHLQDILGPNPKKFRRYLKELDRSLDDHYEKVTKQIAEAVEVTPWLSGFTWDRYAYQFVLCKFVQWLEFNAFLRKSPTMEFRSDWRLL